MNRLLLALAGTLSITLFAHIGAFACSCMSSGPACESYWRVDYVFAGEAIAMQDFKTPERVGDNTFSYSQNRFTFDVKKVYRGEVPERAYVITGAGGGDCGYHFERGRTYLVYGYARDGMMYTGICTRTKPVEDAKEDIAWLDQIGVLAPGATIFGAVKKQSRAGNEFIFAPLTGVSVNLQDSEGKKRSVQTDTNGAYTVAGLPPGKYEVTASSPDGLIMTNPLWNLEVHDRGCAQANFSAVLNGRIRGRVLRDDGAPASGLTVGIAAAKDEYYARTKHVAVGKTVTTRSDGTYELTGLEPGEYFVMTNPYGASKEHPYTRRFYLNSTDAEHARQVGLGASATADDIDFTLPAAFTPMTLEVLVVGRDGKPLEGASVSVPTENSGISFAYSTDRSGVASAEVFAERTYELTVNYKYWNGWYCGGPVTVRPQGKTRVEMRVDKPQGTCTSEPGKK